jgi:hypothetical protein
MPEQTLDADKLDGVLAAAIDSAILRIASLSLAQICAKPSSKAPFVALRENIFFTNLHRTFSSLGIRCDFRSDRATSIFLW